jgi:hypothetical protein
MSVIKIVIDGNEVELEANGKSRNGTYLKYKEPEPYASMGPGQSPLIVTVYQRKGWKPPDASEGENIEDGQTP